MHWLKNRHVYELQRLSHSGRLCRAIILFRKTFGTGSIKMLLLDKKRSVISKRILVSLLGKVYLQLLIKFDQKFFSIGRALRERMPDRHFLKRSVGLASQNWHVTSRMCDSNVFIHPVRVHWLT